MILLVFVLALLVAAPTAQAQERQEHSGWSWSADANAFFGFNYQQRKFRDFSTWESQNWFMVDGRRAVGPGTLAIHSMLSLEPFTIQALGSPQVFQTGEAYHGFANRDRQHPHDLVMGLGVRYSVDREHVGYFLEVDAVGAPALGPTPFMHRESSRENLQPPLSHHNLDSTHITPGVLTAGVAATDFTVAASWFRGEEPNDNRTNIDRPTLDSWSIRAAWQRGPWRAQVSGGQLHRPEIWERTGMKRVTASIEFDGQLGTRDVAATAAWGQNREIHGILDAYLVDWTIQATTRGRFFGRAETLAKDLLDIGGLDPPGFVHFHRISHIAAVTAGYTHDVWRTRWGWIGGGADATLYRVSENLSDPYGSPHSFHVFVRYRPARRAGAPAHIH